MLILTLFLLQKMFFYNTIAFSKINLYFCQLFFEIKNRWPQFRRPSWRRGSCWCRGLWLVFAASLTFQSFRGTSSRVSDSGNSRYVIGRTYSNILTNSDNIRIWTRKSQWNKMAITLVWLVAQDPSYLCIFVPVGSAQRQLSYSSSSSSLSSFISWHVECQTTTHPFYQKLCQKCILLWSVYDEFKSTIQCCPYKNSQFGKPAESPTNILDTGLMMNYEWYCNCCCCIWPLSILILVSLVIALW